MSSYPPRPVNSLVRRAYTAAGLLCAGALAVTGVFIARISDSYAAAHRGSGTATGSGVGQQQDQSGGAQIVQPQQNQAPAGGSNGS